MVRTVMSKEKVCVSIFSTNDQQHTSPKTLYTGQVFCKF